MTVLPRSSRLPFADWGHHLNGSPLVILSRSVRLQMVANNAKGAPLPLLVTIPATKLTSEQLTYIRAGACFRAVGRLELWPSSRFEAPLSVPHLFVTERIEIDDYWIEHLSAWLDTR